MSAQQKRRRDVLFVLLGLVAFTFFLRRAHPLDGVHRAAARRRRRPRRLRLPAAPVQAAGAGAAVEGAVPRRRATASPTPYHERSLRLGAERRPARPASCRSGRPRRTERRGGRDPWTPGSDRSGGRGGARRPRGEARGPRDHALRVAPGDPLVRVGDPGRAPRRVPRGAGADRRGARRTSPRPRSALGAPRRRPLRRVPQRRQEGVRRGEPHARVRRGQPAPDRRRARRRRAAVPQRDGGGGERAAPPGARLPAARRGRRGRAAARAHGRRLRDARDRRLPRRAHRRAAAHDRRAARRARTHARRRDDRDRRGPSAGCDRGTCGAGSHRL